MLTNMIAEVEAMSDEDKKALLETQFPEEMEKEAEAHIDTMGLAESLYNYGYMQGELAVAEVDGFDKIASEDLKAHEESMNSTGEDIDQFLENLKVSELEDSTELHKQAQAAAGLIFQGYVDALEKTAAPLKLKKLMGQAHKKMKAAGKHIMKHKGKYIGGSAAIGAGAYGAKKLMEKKASEATIGDIIEAIDVRDIAISQAAEVEAGVEKLAAKGAKAGSEFLKKIRGAAESAAKTVGKEGKAGWGFAKKHKALVGGTAAGLAGAGAAAGRASKD